MLVRVVKMHFEPHFIEDFKTLFTGVKAKIAASPGCQGVQLLQHETEPSIFFTISHWQGPEFLEQYRTSALFKETWAKVKPHFAHKAEAWSLNEF